MRDIIYHYELYNSFFIPVSMNLDLYTLYSNHNAVSTA